MNVIMKFGGTSVADAEAMRRVIAIVRTHLASHPGANPPVVVVSAHIGVAGGLVSGDALAEVTSRLEHEFGELTTMVRTLAGIREVSPRSTDAILAMGERALAAACVS